MIAIILIVALAYAFYNGLHDAPVILAQLSSSRSIRPVTALILTSAMEFLGAVFFSSMVLKTMSFANISGYWISPAAAGEIQMFALTGLLVALVFNMATWYLGFPSSSTHALFGAMTGAALALGSSGGVLLLAMGKLFVVLVASAIAGGTLGYLLTAGLHQLHIPRDLGWATVPAANGFLGSLMALLHGANDMPKSLGLFLLALGVRPLDAWAAAIEQYAPFIFAAAISLGVLFGENRILRTLGLRIFSIQPLQAFGASIVGAGTLGACTALGFPVSSTQILVGSMLGAGASQNPKAVRWLVVGEILLSWVVTLPACLVLGYITATILS
ncbi:MAG: inorganic phosphate transporter [Elusimicrobia bacterium]|nr:inorganic phosphate transporter [Elusimicrobiota bacterium]